MADTTGEIIALMPAYNEAAFIEDVIKGVLKYIPVVVIDDGSDDETAAKAAFAGAKVIIHNTNQGKGRALTTGFDYAIQRNVEAAITIDADGQHDPDEIPILIRAFRAGRGEMIIGRRNFRQMPGRNHFGNQVGTWLLSAAMGQHIPDNQSGYRLLSRDVLEAARPSTSGFEAEVEIILRTQLAGLKVGWVPIKTIYHSAKISHFHPTRDSARFLRMVWRIWRARRRGSFD